SRKGRFESKLNWSVLRDPPEHNSIGVRPASCIRVTSKELNGVICFRTPWFIVGSNRRQSMGTTVAIATMKVAHISKPGADFQIVEREIPQPGTGEVRIKVQACGICHSDVLTKDGLLPGIEYPRVPGHEVAGVIDELGQGVPGWKKGQRVGVGWHGGHDGTC